MTTRLAALLCLTAATASAQDKMSPRQQQLADAVKWQQGPCVAKLGAVATVKVPAGYQFTDGSGARALEQISGDPPNPSLLGMLTPIAEDEQWSVWFSYNDIGYVKDDEKDSIDADAILASIKAGNEEANKHRQRNGGTTLTVVGWEEKPNYDKSTNRLRWALRGRSTGGDTINSNTRVLGRGGVMSVTLVVPPNDLTAVTPKYKTVLDGFAYVPGQTHAEWKIGDKVAEHGLTALIAGGAVAVAAKTGLLGKLLKPLIVVGALVLAGIGKLFGRKKADTQAG